MHLPGEAPHQPGKPLVLSVLGSSLPRSLPRTILLLLSPHALGAPGTRGPWGRSRLARRRREGKALTPGCCVILFQQTFLEGWMQLCSLHSA